MTDSRGLAEFGSRPRGFEPREDGPNGAHERLALDIASLGAQGDSRTSPALEFGLSSPVAGKAGAPLESLRPGESNIRDGRWRASSIDSVLELRLDRSGQGMASGDLGIPIADHVEWTASFHTAPGEYAASSMRYSVRAFDRQGRTTQAQLVLLPFAAGELLATLTFDHPLEGFPAGAKHSFVARWEAAGLRRLEIVWRCERDQRAPVAVALPNGRLLGVAEIFGENRLEATARTASAAIGAPPGGRWGTVDILTDAGLHRLERQLEGSVRSAGARFPGRPMFQVDVLCLGRSTREGLMGIMFDVADELPRQGAAVFMEEIRRLAGTDADRNILRTTVHEIGHALNLAHRFEPDVGRADSLSFMNYPHRFEAGETAYWQGFGWRFDVDELAFLAHAPWLQVTPGGLPFHSVSYWRDGVDGIVPFRPQSAPAELGYRLELLPPQREARSNLGLIEFGAPIFLGIRLSNKGEAFDVPSHLLDSKAGCLEIRLRRCLSQRNGAPMEVFQPVMARCFDSSDPVVHRLSRQNPLEDNLQLTYGTGGFPFAEPGTYEVEAELRIHDLHDMPRQLLSNRLKLQVLRPRDKQDELDALELFRPLTGVYFALGGAKIGMPNTHQRLRELGEARVARGCGADAVVAAIRRARGIDAGRRYRSELDRATDLLGQLDANALDAFDSITARETTKLLDKQRKRMEGKDTEISRGKKPTGRRKK